MLFGITSFTRLIRQRKNLELHLRKASIFENLLRLVFLGSCFRDHEIVDSPFQVQRLFSDAPLLYQSNLSTLLHGVFGEQGFILLLGLDKRFLEKIGI